MYYLQRKFAPSIFASWQLCIARALLSDCALVVCDEATSSVDPATDARIQTIVRNKFQGRTVLTIAHRLQTVRRREGRVCVRSE